jgi:hypothetical protein
LLYLFFWNSFLSLLVELGHVGFGMLMEKGAGPAFCGGIEEGIDFEVVGTVELVDLENVFHHVDFYRFCLNVKISPHDSKHHLFMAARAARVNQKILPG